MFALARRCLVDSSRTLAVGVCFSTLQMSLPLDAFDVYKGGLPVGFDSAKAANRPLCEFFATPKPLPVGIRTADAVPKGII